MQQFFYTHRMRIIWLGFVIGCGVYMVYLIWFSWHNVGLVVAFGYVGRVCLERGKH